MTAKRAAPRDPRHDPEKGDVLMDGMWVYTVEKVEPNTRSTHGGHVVTYTKHKEGEAQRDRFRSGLGGWRSRWGVLRGPHTACPK